MLPSALCYSNWTELDDLRETRKYKSGTNTVLERGSPDEVMFCSVLLVWDAFTHTHLHLPSPLAVFWHSKSLLVQRGMLEGGQRQRFTFNLGFGLPLVGKKEKTQNFISSQGLKGWELEVKDKFSILYFARSKCHTLAWAGILQQTVRGKYFHRTYSPVIDH